MTVRLHLTTEDLARVRISPAWPFTEVCLSIMQMHVRQSGLIEGWRQQRRADSGRWGPLALVFPASPTIDLHTVVGSAPTMDEALGFVEAASARHLREELVPLYPQIDRAAPWVRRWLRDLVEGDRQVRRELVEMLRDYHARAIAPHWDDIRALLDAERGRRARVMGEGGVEQLLGSLHPRIRWSSPILEIAGSDPDAGPAVDYFLDGRSIVVVPTVFGLETPHVLHNLADDSAPFVLTYPALRQASQARALWTPRGGADRAGLAMALGTTRARALEAIADTCTTTELAGRLGVSPSTASDHATRLRMARLVRTERIGNAVLHSLTSLGQALLEGPPPGHHTKHQHDETPVTAPDP